MDAPVRILLVEDNPADVFLMREALQQAGMRFELTVIEDGEEALRRMRRESPYEDAPRPDMVLLDLNLPRNDGREVLQAIRSDPEMNDTIVAILSSSESPLDRRQVAELKANCYITKLPDLDQYMQIGVHLRELWESNRTKARDR